MTKTQQFLNLLSEMDNIAGVARLDALIRRGETLRRQATERGMKFDALEDIAYQQREDLAACIAGLWLKIQENEACKGANMLAFHMLVTGPRVVYLEPDQKRISVQPVERKAMFKAIRSRHLWEALDVTMKRRAAEEYRELAKQKTFKVRGLGVHEGQLVFVYSFWNEEHTQLCLYRLPVREEDLPDLPMAAEA
jgi:hypothetical protein